VNVTVRLPVEDDSCHEICRILKPVDSVACIPAEQGFPDPLMGCKFLQ